MCTIYDMAHFLFARVGTSKYDCTRLLGRPVRVHFLHHKEAALAVICTHFHDLNLTPLGQ